VAENQEAEEDILNLLAARRGNLMGSSGNRINQLSLEPSRPNKHAIEAFTDILVMVEKKGLLV